MTILRRFPGAPPAAPIGRRRGVNLVETMVCKLSSVSNQVEHCNSAVEMTECERLRPRTAKIFPGDDLMVLL